MKKVLFIVYNFPPHGGVGVQRSLKFVKYLPQFGWQPTVVTTNETATAVQDPSLLPEIPPQTEIIRIPSFNIQQPIKHAAFPLNRMAVLLNVLLQVPDTAVFWARKTYHFLHTYLEQNQFDLLYTTSGPYSTHLIGVWLKKAYPNIPWVADFRDPWSQNIVIPYLPSYRFLNRRQEQRVLQTADRLIHVTQTWLDDAHALAPHLPVAKFQTIPNGYDEAQIQPIAPATNQQFTLLYTGGFNGARQPDAFIKGVQYALRTDMIPVDMVRFVFIGSNMTTHIPDEPPFERHEFMSQASLNQYRQQADALLLILNTAANNKGRHTGKLLEYIALNRPILGIVPPDGEAAQLIHKTQTGLTSDGHPRHIAEALTSMYEQWHQPTRLWQPNWDIITQYTRRNLTQQLAHIFDQLLAEQTP